MTIEHPEFEYAIVCPHCGAERFLGTSVFRRSEDWVDAETLEHPGVGEIIRSCKCRAGMGSGERMRIVERRSQKEVAP